MTKLSASGDSGNLFADLPQAQLADELFSTLLSYNGVRIEKIVSTGQATQPDQWYDQESAEWVLLVRGSACVRFADEGQDRSLAPGDFLYIASHRQHRVQATDANEPTVWLAIHLDAN